MPNELLSICLNNPRIKFCILPFARNLKLNTKDTGHEQSDMNFVNFLLISLNYQKKKTRTRFTEDY